MSTQYLLKMAAISRREADAINETPVGKARHTLAGPLAPFSSMLLADGHRMRHFGASTLGSIAGALVGAGVDGARTPRLRYVVFRSPYGTHVRLVARRGAGGRVLGSLLGALGGGYLSGHLGEQAQREKLRRLGK